MQSDIFKSDFFSVKDYAAEQRRRISKILEVGQHQQIELEKQRNNLENSNSIQSHNNKNIHSTDLVSPSKSPRHYSKLLESNLNFDYEKFNAFSSIESDTDIRRKLQFLLEEQQMLLEQEQAVADKERNINQMFDKFTDKKNILITRLENVKIKEQLITEQEAGIKKREETQKNKSMELNNKIRDFKNKQSLLSQDIVKQKSKLELKKQQISQIEKDNQRTLERMQYQLSEMGQKLSSANVKLNAREREIEEMKHEIISEEFKLREQELQAIDSLKRNLQNKMNNC